MPLINNTLEEQLVIISTPIYITIITLEIILSAAHHLHLYRKKDTATNVYLMLLNASVDVLFRLFYIKVWLFFYNHSATNVLHGIWYWIVLVVAEDFLYYWLHRFDHEIRFFWATHVTHHSSLQMNFSVGFRSSVFQPLYRFIYFIPLAWLGFSPADILAVYAATQIWGILVHTQLIKSMGWLEYILVTPSHHRVHHASNPKYLDKNMGMFLIVWDKLFGTFQAELPEKEYKPIQFGLTKNIEKANPFTIVMHEWIAIWKDVTQKNISWQQRWKYLFGPPGYSHNGSRLTSKQMLRIEEANKQYE